MGLSLWIAVTLPFKLFLFSYAILGPLHYLTEINWLKDKNYFIKSKKTWIYVYVFLALIIAIVPIIKFVDFSINNSLDEIMRFISSKKSILLLGGLLFAISLIFVEKSYQLVIALALSFLLAVLLSLFLPSTVLILGIFLPTVLHVYLFTLLFMIYGALRSKSKIGLFAALLLLLVPFTISNLDIVPQAYEVSKKTQETFDSSTMTQVNGLIAQVFGWLYDGKYYALSPNGLKIQIFIAFAYTYHYLNWFSKTSIIGWKNALTTKKSILIFGIWTAAVALYLYDFKTGFIALFFLSLTHVFLEFPLNIITIKELFLIGRTKKVKTS
jgi:hypothetical protein